jgi:hypothetical protein
MSGREAVQIGRTATSKMRAGDPEMVEKLGQADFDPAVLREFYSGCDDCSPRLSPA